MKKSWLFLAAGLLSSLAFSTPSQAGGTLITTDASFSISMPAGTTASDFEFKFTQILPTSNLKITSTNLPGATIGAHGDVVVVNFSPASSGFVDFSFITKAAASSVGLQTFFLTGASAPILKANVSASVRTVGTASLPEPGSMALLGIGLSGLIAFRRFMKRPVVA